MRYLRIVGVIVLAVLVVGLAGGIFQAGYLAGAAADGGAVVYPAYCPGWGWGFGWGGGIFHLLGFLFFLFLFLGLLRLVFGGGRRGWGPGPRHGGWSRGWDAEGHDHDRFGPWADRARAVHDEWHRTSGASGDDAGSGPGPKAG